MDREATLPENTLQEPSPSRKPVNIFFIASRVKQFGHQLPLLSYLPCTFPRTCVFFVLLGSLLTAIYQAQVQYGTNIQLSPSTNNGVL